MNLHTMAHGWDEHLDEDQAEQYSMGALPEAEEARWEEHLLVCGSCRRQVLAADKYVAAMKGAAVTMTAETRRTSRFGWSVLRPAWVLAAALLVIAGASLLRYQPIGPPVAVQLTTVRGAQVGAFAPAGADLVLFADISGLAPAAGYRLELVDATGRVQWSGPFVAGGTRASRQNEGVYFVRLRSAQGELLREYGLEISKTRGASSVPR
jgi:hypothetical protein